ncbi:ATP synthase subunit g, mitochondrial-like [Cydia pomonella]|uniref:ATP synthase subunit g, mitochondrial-like n=1 Tax=Cydia pomonella TaxID=82600 RepID=UPI002ADDC55B|nr:ATP synthase subunit g, mitochondrial-like [Cydia pomonella]XP_061724503.1 ATP synthase subunit g, mitochondrial-like [Cydia pomonella]
MASALINNAIASARPKFAIFMKYAKVELAPPKLGEIPQIKAGIGKLLSSAKSGAWKNQTVKEATLNTLVGMEVLFWFYIGECIGKRHIVGYDV